LNEFFSLSFFYTAYITEDLLRGENKTVLSATFCISLRSRLKPVRIQTLENCVFAQMFVAILILGIVNNRYKSGFNNYNSVFSIKII